MSLLANLFKKRERGIKADTQLGLLQKGKDWVDEHGEEGKMFAVLSAIEHRPSASVKDIAGELGIDTEEVKEAVEELVKKGYIRTLRG